MLKIYDMSDIDVLHPLNIPDSAWSITHVYDGNDILSFELSAEHEAYPLIAEEVRVEDEKNRYTVKNIDEHNGIVVVDCKVDLDDWREKFWKEYRSTGSYLAEVLEQIKPEGWTVVGDSAYTKRDTVEASEGEPLKNVVALDILSKACEVYGAIVNYDVLRKTLHVINLESYTDSGEYFTDELNLRSVGYTGNSTDLVTRLYAYGKEDEDGIPLTFASINNGKEYVEDNSYSDSVISVGWSDERYTIPENLLAAAKEKLKELAYPVRSYECDVRNMDADIWLYKMVTLIDRRRGIRIKHRVIEYREFPKRHDLDVVTISAAVPRIESEIKQVKDNIQRQGQEQKMIIQQGVSDATDRITGTKGGNIRFNYQDKKPFEMLVMDTDNINTAKDVWRWNLGGLGHSKNGYQGPYDTAMTADGKIVADFIQTGTLDATLLKAGKISDNSGNSFWDLDNGGMQMTGTFRTQSQNGNYTEMSPDGLAHYSSAGKEYYCYMTHVGSITFNSFTSNYQGNGYKSGHYAIMEIQLPSKFKGRNIVVTPYLQGIKTKYPDNDEFRFVYDCITNIGMSVINIDKDNAKFKLRIDIGVYCLGGQTVSGALVATGETRPESVTLGYTVIA